ncbi:Rne/Rng family ribonuclease [Persicirhabdus sediminis]|uniref:Rne/Rng family ribonuclease n=1 Tax=Persicirhabdus sediminis TaxID=454144 RepID=A0A8J7MFA4_9BACT|nr:Rne/Rng family ribonuclease [Persicirhabdus sediminis]MBK1791656.1 Rne/Rng family ribonuclease [Persicirhabdus sediminis]
MIQRIKKALGVGTPSPDKGVSIVVNAEKLERRIALVEDGSVEEYNVEREGDENIVGGIFKGTVKNIEPGLKAMFVDIGLDKNAFLHFWDAIPAALDGDLEEIERGQKKQQKRITSKDIPNIYPEGSEIMIQVSKGAIGNKGPRVTTNVSLAGRYLVLMPFSEQFGISRKVDDPKERQRLRRIMQKLQVPEGMGIIMRTVAQGQRARHFVRDLAMLLEQWEEVATNRDSKPAPVCCFREPGLIERTARDFLTDNVDNIFCDDPETTEKMRDIAGRISRRAKRRIHHYPARRSIFEKIGIQKQIDDAFHRQVWLPCGGYLVIDETEALIAVDVNTGRNRGSKDVDKMLLQTNLEAAEEVARQLRLRNIGGLVVVDFIDMRHRRDQQAVYRAMRERLKRDKAKTQVLQISSIGLMEMTRQRLNESLRDSMLEPCPYCQGRGRVKTPFTMSVEIQRALNTVIQRNENLTGDIIIVVNGEVLNRFKKEDAPLLMEIERQHKGRLIFRSDPALHRERYAIIDAETEKTLVQA